MKNIPFACRKALIGIATIIAVVCQTQAAAPEGSDEAKRKHQITAAVEGRELAAKQGWLVGMRAVEFLRADLLSVTVDPGITGAIGMPDWEPAFVQEAIGGPADYLRPEAFTVSSLTDPDYQQPVHPARVGHCSYEGRNTMQGAKIGWYLFNTPIFHHDFFLFLPKPLKSGHTYTVAAVPQRGAKDGLFAWEKSLAYNEAKTTTKALKVNQLAYSPLATQRYAYLGWWAGNLGKVDYAGFKTFAVVDETTGTTAARGEVKLREANEKRSGEDIYELDLSGLKSGRYHLQVPGLACSESFAVGGANVQALYYYTMRGLFHQRCGQELRPPWTWVKRPACHSEVLPDGVMVSGQTVILQAPGTGMQSNAVPASGEVSRHFRGGYHDAADYDSFSYHLTSASQLLMVFENEADMLADGDLDLPESGNGIPDILDEVAWGLAFHLENQYPNGAVPLGRGNLCDAFEQNIVNGGLKPGQVIPPYGILPPRSDSTPTFAAVAAQFSRLIRKYDPALADRHLAAARRAFAYASTNTPEQIRAAFSTTAIQLKPDDDLYWKNRLCWAAAELLRATGEAQYNDFIKANAEALRMTRAGNATQRAYAYAMADRKAVDPLMQDRCRQELISRADGLVEATQAGSYRMALGAKEYVGWGAAQGINYADTLLAAFYVTHNRKYLDAVSLNADWHLGCNPRSQTFLTHMGIRYPHRPEISYYLYEDPANDLSGATVRGINIFGLGPPLKDWFGPWPAWRSWRDVWDHRAEIYSEFVIPVVGQAAMVYSALYAETRRAGLVPANAKPDPLEH